MKCQADLGEWEDSLSAHQNGNNCSFTIFKEWGEALREFVSGKGMAL